MPRFLILWRERYTDSHYLLQVQASAALSSRFLLLLHRPLPPPPLHQPFYYTLGGARMLQVDYSTTEEALFCQQPQPFFGVTSNNLSEQKKKITSSQSKKMTMIMSKK
jgi:hypothetical protein